MCNLRRPVRVEAEVVHDLTNHCFCQGSGIHRAAHLQASQCDPCSQAVFGTGPLGWRHSVVSGSALYCMYF